MIVIVRKQKLLLGLLWKCDTTLITMIMVSIISIGIINQGPYQY